MVKRNYEEDNIKDAIKLLKLTIDAIVNRTETEAVITNMIMMAINVLLEDDA